MFDVYNLLDIEPVKAEKAYFWDREGNKYLDFYGGHAVISIGHSHPHYVELVTAIESYRVLFKCREESFAGGVGVEITGAFRLHGL